MRTLVVPLVVLGLFLLAPPQTTHAQYMFLDANGNGAHDPGDCILSSGPKTIGIYLNSAANRDGTPAACPDTRVNSFGLVLRASGPFSGAAYTSILMSGVIRDQSATDIYIETASSGAVTQGGLLHLGDLTLTTSSGVSIEIGTTTALGKPQREYLTMFGTPCDGVQFDNTYRLGQDWFDADGLCSETTFEVDVSGTVFQDPGGLTTPCPTNGSDPPVTKRAVQLLPSGRIAYTNQHGLYRFVGHDPGTFSVSLLPQAPWQQSCPQGLGSWNVNPLPGEKLTDINFAVAPSQVTQDLYACVSVGRLRPGFSVTYAVYGENLGTVTVQMTMSLTIDSDLGAIVLITDGGTYSNGVVTWPATTFLGGTYVTRYVTVVVPSTVPIGTVVTNTVTIDPVSGDANPANNVCSSTEIIRGAVDPNEKHVSPAGRILRSTPLFYHVDFQNVGTDTAFNVVVRDNLDPNLDASTFKSGISRHPYSVEIDGHAVTWTFANILLPDSTASEVNSHGFVEYAIMPSSSAPDGAVLGNFADIYFDFNAPVRTNAVADTIDSPPFLHPVPDRTVVEGNTVDQPLVMSDPEGDFVVLAIPGGPPWASVTSTGPSNGNLHLAPQSGDAGPHTVTIQASDGILTHQQTASVGVLAVTAVGMTEQFKAQELRLSSNRAVCLQLSPASRSFRPEDIDPASLAVTWGGTRHELSPWPNAKSDESGPGTLCFKANDVRRAFATLDATKEIETSWEGRLRSGEAFSGTMRLTVRVAEGHLAASFTPNPLNPTATLKFRTRSAGYARVRLYGLDGRIVRTLLDSRSLEPGYHVMEFNGRDDAGNRVASGLYFYEIETAEGYQSGRVTVLK